MQIDVVIPTFNRAEFLKDAIESVLNQTYENLKLYIIDDGSEDQTEQVVQKYNDPRIVYSKKSNSGVSSARNKGVNISSNSWIAFLDSDDTWEPNKLELFVSQIEKEPNISIFYSDEKWIKDGAVIVKKQNQAKHDGEIFFNCLKSCFIGPSTVLIKRDVFLDVGLFDDRYVVCEDYELWLRISEKYKIRLIEKELTRKLGGHADQLSTKYHSMNYWRVKALFEAYLRNSNHLERKIAIKNAILEKAEPLKKGYLKHNNLEKISEINVIISQLD